MALVFTEAAAKKVDELKREEADPDLNLRVYITGGGCSGFQYGFTFDPKINEDDYVRETNDVKLVVDAMSHAYLEQATVDYREEDVKGGQFVISNPDAKTTCGCGASFSA